MSNAKQSGTHGLDISCNIHLYKNSKITLKTLLIVIFGYTCVEISRQGAWHGKSINLLNSPLI